MSVYYLSGGKRGIWTVDLRGEVGDPPLLQDLFLLSFGTGASPIKETDSSVCTVLGVNRPFWIMMMISFLPK